MTLVELDGLRPSITDHRRLLFQLRVVVSRTYHSAQRRGAGALLWKRVLGHPESGSAIYDVLIHVRSLKHTHTGARARARARFSIESASREMVAE